MIETPDLTVEAKSASITQERTDIVAAPARFVHPERIVACYDGAITLDIARDLQCSDRVQQQLTILLMDHFELSALPDLTHLDDADLALMTASFEQIGDLVSLAGAVFWSHVFASEIRTSEVAAMKRRFGETIFQTAIAHRDLAGNLPGPDDLAALEALMASDGLRCIASWHEALPARIGAWARLRHASDSLPSPDTTHGKFGPAIIRRLAADLPRLHKDGAQ